MTRYGVKRHSRRGTRGVKRHSRKKSNKKKVKYTMVDESTFNNEQKQILEDLRMLPDDSNLVKFIKLGKFSPEQYSEELKKEGYLNIEPDTIRAFRGGAYLLK